jgi:uncharacterized protein
MSQFAPQARYAEEETTVGANPTPLGLIALAVTTALVGASFAHFLIPVLYIGMGIVVGPAIFFGGLVQLLAGMWEFRRHHTLAATLFSAYGGFLLAFGILFTPTFSLTALFGADIRAFNHALGLFFFCWAITCGVLFLGALRTNLALLAVLACLTLAYLLLAIGEFANANFPLLAIGGCLAMICALVAWYASLGGILQSTRSPFQLPMGEVEETPLPSHTHGYGGEPVV